MSLGRRGGFGSFRIFDVAGCFRYVDLWIIVFTLPVIIHAVACRGVSIAFPCSDILVAGKFLLVGCWIIDPIGVIAGRESLCVQRMGCAILCCFGQVAAAVFLSDVRKIYFGINFASQVARVCIVTGCSQSTDSHGGSIFPSNAEPAADSSAADAQES